MLQHSAWRPCVSAFDRSRAKTDHSLFDRIPPFAAPAKKGLTAEQGPIVQLTNGHGAQTLKIREQLSKKSSEALGSIENLMKSSAEKHGALDLPHARYAEAETMPIARRRAPIVDLRYSPFARSNDHNGMACRGSDCHDERAYSGGSCA